MKEKKIENLAIVEEHGIHITKEDLRKSLDSLLLQYGENMIEETKKRLIDSVESAPPFCYP